MLTILYKCHRTCQELLTTSHLTPDTYLLIQDDELHIRQPEVRPPHTPPGQEEQPLDGEGKIGVI